MNLDEPINRFDEAMLVHLSSLLKGHPRNVKMQPVFSKLDKIMPKYAAKKVFKARDKIWELAPDALTPWLLVRAGGKRSEWVGMKEIQQAALMGAGLVTLRPKTVKCIFLSTRLILVS